MENKAAISAVKINSGGLKGLEVCYSKVEKGKDDRDWINEYWTARSFPVNKELDALVKSFRFYLYDVYGYDMDKVNDAELEINEVKSEMGSESGVVDCKSRVYESNNNTGAVAPSITATGSTEAPQA